MGWTGLKTKKSFLEVFDSEYGASFGPHKDHSLLKVLEVKIPKNLQNENTDDESELFCAIKENRKGNVYCLVVLIERIEDEVLYKAMDEFTGPYCLTKCPKEIADLLSPIDNWKDQGYMKGFRQRNSINK